MPVSMHSMTARLPSRRQRISTDPPTGVIHGSQERCERSAQLVRKHGKKAVLGERGLFGHCFCCAQFVLYPFALCDVAQDHRCPASAVRLIELCGRDLGEELAAVAATHSELAANLPVALALFEIRRKPGVGFAYDARASGQAKFFLAAAEHPAGCRVGCDYLPIRSGQHHPVHAVHETPAEEFLSRGANGGIDRHPDECSARKWKMSSRWRTRYKP